MDIEAQSSNQKTLQCLRSVHLPRLVPCQQIVGLTFSNCVVIGKQESWERARQRRVYRRMYTLSETRNEASHRLASSLKSRDTQVVPAITSSGHKVDLCGHRAISKTLRYISLRLYFWTTTNMHASLVVRVCIDKPQGIRNFQENESEIERERERSLERKKEREGEKEGEREEEVPPWSDHSGHGTAWEKPSARIRSYSNAFSIESWHPEEHDEYIFLIFLCNVWHPLKLEIRCS